MTPVTWTASVGGGVSAKCQFWREDAGDWRLAQDYGSCQYTWTPRAEDAGSHSLRVWVRNADSLAAFDGGQVETFTVLPSLAPKPDAASSRPDQRRPHK